MPEINGNKMKRIITFSKYDLKIFAKSRGRYVHAKCEDLLKVP